MTTADLRKYLRVVGVGPVVVNLLLWAFVLIVAPLQTPTEWFLSRAEAPEPGAMQFDIPRCFDCPMARMFGREFLSYWDPLPVKIFLVANLPALIAGRGPRDTWGTSELRPIVVLLVSSLQWFLVARTWHWWRRSPRSATKVVVAP